MVYLPLWKIWKSMGRMISHVLWKIKNGPNHRSDMVTWLTSRWFTYSSWNWMIKLKIVELASVIFLKSSWNPVELWEKRPLYIYAYIYICVCVYVCPYLCIYIYVCDYIIHPLDCCSGENRDRKSWFSPLNMLKMWTSSVHVPCHIPASYSWSLGFHQPILCCMWPYGGGDISHKHG